MPASDECGYNGEADPGDVDRKCSTTKASNGCRSAASLVQRVDCLVRERRVEVIGNGEEAAVSAGNAFSALFLVRREPSNRRPSPGDDDLLANGYPFQQPREMGLCLMSNGPQRQRACRKGA